jgi:hypothetical protein
MNQLITAALLSLSLTAFANPQHQVMKTCNADAKTKALKGSERKAFMKECLSKGKEEVKKAKTTQQEKMKTCNADAKAKALKGADRKAFMKSCLSGSSAPAAPVAPAAPAAPTN